MGVRPKKHLGQHFLHDKNIARKIAASLSGQTGNVLEVGPGTGMLTGHLTELGYRLKAVETDSESVDYLLVHGILAPENIIHGDFLKLDLSRIFHGEPFAVVGNFPYNISSQIVFKALDNRQWIPEFTGMFQKELAQRMVEPSGSKVYGVLSVMVQAYYRPEYLFSVPPSVFIPPPKVISGVVRLVRKPDYHLPCDEKLFSRVVKSAFNTRRKMLRSSLKGLLSAADMQNDHFFEKRPEQLDVADFVRITTMIQRRESPEKK